MEEIKKPIIKNKQLGENCYLNKNCWLVKNLNYSPYKRCQYCEFKFRNCLFLQYQVISGVLIVISFLLFIILEKKISIPAIITIFLSVITYGYFFNTSTESIIKSNFSLKKAKTVLKELTNNLESKVQEQTEDILKKNVNLEKQAHQLEKDKKELVNLDRMKDEFLQMATHELNTPITVIQGKLSMAIDEDMCHLDKKQMEFLQPVLVDTMRLASLSKDILNARRIDQNRMSLNASEADIDGLIALIVSGFEVKTKDKDNSISYVRLSKELPKIFFDESKISEVISNLISNANKFTEHGKITVTSKVEKDEIVVSISDNGVGISQEDQKYLFQKFYQAGRFDPKNPQEQQGSGLGLYISRNIIQLHGGKMWLKSEKGHGSSFSFSLPLENRKLINNK